MSGRFLRAVALALVVFSFALAAPGSRLAGAGQTNRDELGAGQPAVRLERVIRTQRDLGRGRLLGWLTGRRDPALFVRPYGVAWDGEALLVTDPGAGRVLRIDRRGAVRKSPPRLFTSPIGVALCRGGILVSDSHSGRVALLDGELRLRRWVAERLDRPTGVACDGDRFFIVETGNHRVLVLEPVGWPVELTPRSRKMIEAGGRFFVPIRGTDRALVFEPDRTTHALGRRGEATGEFNFPTAISSAAGQLWIGDTLNFRVQRFDPASGDFRVAFGQLGDAAGEMPRLKGIAVDGRGRLWVSDAHLDQVALYDAEGRFLTALGRSGKAPGEFTFPSGIAMAADGRVAVIDSLNRRVQIFRPLAEVGS